VTRGKRWLLTALIAVALPAAGAAEQAISRALLPPEVDELRRLLAPAPEIAAWVAVALAALAAFAGPRLQRWFFARRAGRAPNPEVEALLVATSVVQLPALLALLAVALGAGTAALLASLVVSTAGVAVQGASRPPPL